MHARPVGNDHRVAVRQATIDDAPALAVIGPAAYAESYSDLWADPVAYAAHLGTFDKTAFERLLGSEHAAWVALVGQTIVGFLSMNTNSPDPIRRREAGAEISRIYLLKPCRGRGIGRLLFEAAEQRARTEGCEYLWLDAMMTAEAVWRTYERWGFRRIGEKLFDKPVVTDQRSMVVLSRAL